MTDSAPRARIPASTSRSGFNVIELSDSLIRATVTANAYVAGLAYMRNGRVKAIGVEPTRGTIRATVQGSGGAKYKLAINVAEKGGNATVNGECSCPVGYNCKHVAAVLFAQKQLGRVPVATKPAQLKPALPPVPAASVLPQAVAAWLSALSDSQDEDSEAYPSTVSKRLLYMLGTRPGQGAPLLQVLLAVGDIKRDGAMGGRSSTPDAYRLLQTEPAPKYLRPSDRGILRTMSGDTLDRHRGDSEAALRNILATGRARMGEYPGTLARLADPRTGTLNWRLDASGNQTPIVEIDGGGNAVLLETPWYLDPATAEVGKLEIPLPPAILRRLLNAPPIGFEQAAAVRQALSASLSHAGVPLPREVPHGGTISGKPTPMLRLERLHLAYGDNGAQFGNACASLSFQYGNIIVSAQTPQGPSERLVNGTRYTLLRTQAAEKKASAELQKVGFAPLSKFNRWGTPPELSHHLVLAGTEAGAQWIYFMLDTVPTLHGMGWQIIVAEDFPHRVIAPDGPLQAELREGSGIDWFDLDLGVTVGEERIDLVPPLLKMLAGPYAAAIIANLSAGGDGAGRKLVLSLNDGRTLALEIATIRGVLTTLFDLFNAGGLSERGAKLSFSRHGAAGVAALERAGLAAGLVWRGGEALRALGRMLHERGGITRVGAPDWFEAELRPYQQQGVDWLQFLREAGLAGVLADDMGLGKTVQTLAHLCIEKQEGRLSAPALVICPTSVVGNWAREAARFAPVLRVLPLQGTDRKTRFGEIDDADLVISTYPLLARDGEVLCAREWHTLILDEAQTVKNPAATMAQTVRRLRAGQRICLTGTPMENHLGELWALFDFMMPGFLGSAQDFARRFRTPIEKGGDAVRHAALARRVSPFLLRRTKADVLAELPARTDIAETIQMQPPQRAVYDGIRLAMHARVQAAIAEKGLAKSGIVILDALLKLRQACCDPRLLKITGAKKAGSAKLERLMELLVTMLEEGRAILLFSQFTSMLALIEDELHARGIDYALLTGSTVNRAAPVDHFQSGRVKLFLVSLKAGGVGLNLTAADTVIHYDPWWNPAVENQATDRAHRIGQTKAVFVHRLTVENTIEEKMEVLKARKSALAEGILSGAGASALKMTEADVELLFGD